MRSVLVDAVHMLLVNWIFPQTLVSSSLCIDIECCLIYAHLQNIV